MPRPPSCGFRYLLSLHYLDQMEFETGSQYPGSFPVNSYPNQLIPMSTRTQRQGIPELTRTQYQLIPKSTRTQSQLVPKVSSYPNQTSTAQHKPSVTGWWILVRPRLNSVFDQWRLIVSLSLQRSEQNRRKVFASNNTLIDGGSHGTLDKCDYWVVMNR